MGRSDHAFYVQYIIPHTLKNLFLKFCVINENNAYTAYVSTESVEIYLKFSF